MKRWEIKSKYDEFFGTGFWEKEYKEHIVIFAEQCVNASIDAEKKAKYAEGYTESNNIQNDSVSFSADSMNKVDKYHKQTLNKVNEFYKYLYDRTISATELSDQQQEAFAYLKLTNDVKEAYKKFRDTLCTLANER